jgi:hypothetical protein
MIQYAIVNFEQPKLKKKKKKKNRKKKKKKRRDEARYNVVLLCFKSKRKRTSSCTSFSVVRVISAIFNRLTSHDLLNNRSVVRSVEMRDLSKLQRVHTSKNKLHRRTPHPSRRC